LKTSFDDESAADGNIHGESDLVISMAFRNCMRTFHGNFSSKPFHQKTRYENAQRKAGREIMEEINWL